MGQTEARDFGAVVGRAERSEHLSERLGDVEGMPVLATHLGTGQATGLLIAGTHGDEPATVEAALQVLERKGDNWLCGMSIDVLLCTNPTGYVHNRRETAAGVDINWAWARYDVPEIEILRRFLHGRRYDFVVDFHEDWETPGFYLYEHRLDVPAAGPRMVKAVAAVCAINRDTQIENWPAQDGVVTADSSRERIERGDGFPLVLLRDHTPHKLTTETPTELPMETRVQAHHAALDALLAHYAEASGRP